VTGVTVSPDELAQVERHIFVSPHYDDIALSCGGTAALLAQHGRQPVISLLFGSEPDPAQPLTSFAEGMHRQWGMEASEVIAGRRKEEAAALDILGARDELLPFLDAIYRGARYTSDPELFGSLAQDDSDLPSQIIEALDLGKLPDGSTRIYVPLAVGNHVDHQIAFAAGIELARAGWDVWFYEDLPYALRSGSREERFANSDLAFTVAATVNVDSVWTSKIDAIMAYPSQLGVIFGYIGKGHDRDQIQEVMKSYAREIGGGTPVERFWKLA
jgi:LmbE family N-acetylglucosaminyl deacetylase